MDCITVFHGSEKIIEKPLFGGGKRNNDYGRGFYCTESEDLAKEWACGRNHDGFVNRYELNREGLTILNLNSPEYNILNWLELLTENRTYWQRSSIAEDGKNYLRDHFRIDKTILTSADIIIGYRADDSYFSFAQDFVAGAISLRTLSMAMHLGKLGEQVVLKSRKAFDQIRFKDAEPVEARIWFARKADRDLEARRAYRESRRDNSIVSMSAGTRAEELYMIDIIRERMTNDDPRLR